MPNSGYELTWTAENIDQQILKIPGLEAKIGDLSTLTTEQKANLVAAINELVTSVATKTKNSNISASFDATKAYSAGDYVIYEGDLYRAKEDIPAGAWDESKWTLISIGEDLVKKANRDDYCPDMTVGAAEQIVSSRQIDDPELSCPPIVIGTTGGEAEIQTGRNTFEYMEGNSVKYNELAYPFVDYAVGGNWKAERNTVSASFIDGVAAFSSSESNWGIVSNIVGTSYSFLLNHKYLGFFYAKSASPATLYFRLSSTGAVLYSYALSGSDYQRCSCVYQHTNANINSYVYFMPRDDASLNIQFSIRNFVFIDLTALEINTTDPDEAIAILKSRGIDVNGYLPYNTGTILDAQTSEMVSTRFNQWDEELEAGALNAVTGANVDNPQVSRSKNYVEVIGGTSYYFYGPNTDTNKIIWAMAFDRNKNVITERIPDLVYSDNVFLANNKIVALPESCAYIRFYVTNTPNHDVKVCLNLCEWGGVVDTGRNGEYEKADFQKVTLPNIPLRSVPNYADPENPIRDIAYSVGGGKRRVGIIVYDGSSDEHWLVYGGISSCRFAIAVPSDCPVSPVASVIGNISCNKLKAYAKWTLPESYAFSRGDEGDSLFIFRINESVNSLESLRTWLTSNPLTVRYALATETDIPVSENPGWTESVYTDNYGTIQFHTDPQQSPQVPQPYFIKYTINLVDFTDTAYVKTKGDANNIVTYVDLEEEGYVVPKSNEAGIADQLLSNKAVTDQIPFLFRGMPNGVGNRAYDKLVGFNVNWNSILTNGDFVNTNDWTPKTGAANFSVSNNVASVTCLATGDTYVSSKNLNMVVGHKYLCYGSYKAGYTGSTTPIVLYFFHGEGSDKKTVYAANNTSWNDFGVIAQCNSNTYNFIRLQNGAEVNAVNQYRNINVIDLTQLFGPTIADYLYGLPNDGGITLFRKLFPKPFYPFCESKILSVKASGKKYQGVNQWDEEWEVGDINEVTGQNATSASLIRSKNYTRVIPGMTYYLKCNVVNCIYFYDADKKYLGEENFIRSHPANSTFIVPANAYFMRFNPASSYGTTYSHDICINISDPAINGTYYHHEEWNVSLDENVELNGVLKLDAGNNLYADGDIWESGKKTKKYLIADPQELSWTYESSSDQVFFHAVLPNAKNAAYTDTNAWMTGYAMKPSTAGWTTVSFPNKSIGRSMTAIRVRDNDYTDVTTFKAHLSGIIVYEADESTEESAPSFVNPSPCNPYGTENYIVPTDEDTGVEMPVGHETTYPQNLQKKLDDMPNLPTANGQYVLDINGANATYTELQSWLTSNGYNKMQDLLGVFGIKDAVGGCLRHQLATEQNIDFTATDWVDLGDLTWTLFSTNSYIAYPPNIINWSGDSEVSPNILCSRYKTVMRDNVTAGIAQKANYVMVYSTLSADQLKASLKGTILAYKKSS